MIKKETLYFHKHLLFWLETHPERLFLIIAIPFGLLFTFVIPPFAGEDESFHFQRTAEIAYLQALDRQAEVPSGIVNFINFGRSYYLKVGQDTYPLSDFATPKEIPLEAGHLKNLRMNIFTVHNPINYVPQAIAFRVAAEAGVKPYYLLYISRLVGLAAGIFITWLAIRLIPSHKYLLAAFALLPTIVFYRSYLHTDAITNSIAFIFIAVTLRAISEARPIRLNESFMIGLLGVFVASCKGAYLPLSLLVLAIPPGRFGTNGERVKFVIATVLAAFVAGFGWMYLVKAYLFTGYTYQTYGGRPMPDEQLAFILSQPFQYLGVVVNTLFFTPFFLVSLRGIIAQPGHGYVLLYGWAYGLVFFLFACVAVLDISSLKVNYSRFVRALALFIFLICFGLALTLLYVQWTSVQAPIIKGFQGRYFIPLLPLLFLFIKPAKEVTQLLAGLSVTALGVLGLSAASWSLCSSYFP